MNSDFEHTNLIKHRITGGAVAGVSLLLLLAEAPVLVIFGLMGGMAGGAYALATCTLATTIQRSESRLEAELRTLAARQDEVKKERDRIKAELLLLEAQASKMKSDAESLQANVKAQFDADIQAARKALAQEFRDKGDDLAAEYARKVKSLEDEKLDRIKFHKSKLVGDNAQLFKRCEELETLLEQRDEYLKREFNRRLESYGNAYEEMQKAILAQGATVGEARASFEAQYQVLIDERDRLAKAVRRLQAPKRFRRTTDNDLRGNKILDFYKSKGLLLEGEDWSEKFNHVEFYLFPMPQVTFADVETHLKDLGLHLGVYAKPKAVVEDGFIKLTVQVGNKPEEITVPSRPLTKLETTIEQCNHVTVVGASGAGKSVFMDNLIWMGRAIWPDSEETIFDPKFQLENWSEGIAPTYKNAKCVPAIGELSKALYARLEEYEELTDQGIEPQVYPKHQFIVDEAEQLFMHAQDLHIEDPKPKYPAQVSRSFTRLLNLGRALNVRGYFVRHKDLVKPLGLNDGQFDGCVNIFLGKGHILKALNKGLTALYSDAELEIIKAEYEKRLKLGQKFIALVADILKNDIYLIEMPRPGYYADQYAHKIGKPIFPGFKGSAPSTATCADQVETAETVAIDTAPSSTEICADEASAELAPDSTKGSTDLAQLLAQGTHCPNCSVHSAVYKRKKPTKKGEVTVTCKTPNCESGGSFKWKVV